MGQTVKQETQRFKHYGEQTVRDAAELIAKLPNGWRLISFRWDVGIAAWVAVVQGVRRDVDTGEEVLR